MSNPPDLHKYPRTHHIEGSRLQSGDHDLDSVPFAEIAGRNLVVEEKMDGANAAISFSAKGDLLLQSRGHYLTGGRREKHFALFKQWASVHQGTLHAALGDRYILYGEWLFARHTVFYNRLPHYFLEFDVLDKHTGAFLSTARRQEMLDGLPIASVEVLKEGRFERLDDLTDLVGPSRFIQGDHLSVLRRLAEAQGLDADLVMRETDRTNLMEGLYIKVEEGGVVQGRYKWVRAGFLSTVLESESHWLNRPIIPNQLAPGVDIFAGVR